MDEVDFDTSIDTNAVQADMPQSQRGAEDAVAAEGPGHHSEDFNLHAFDENVEPAHESQRIGDPEMINEGATAAADPTPSVQADKMEGKAEMAGEQPFDIFSVDALLERMLLMWRAGPGRPVRSGLRNFAGSPTKQAFINLTQARDLLLNGNDPRKKGQCSLEEIFAFTMGDIAGLPPMPPSNSIKVGEKITREAKDAKAKIAAAKKDAQRLFPKAAEQTDEQRAALAKAIAQKQDPTRRTTVDLALPSAAACAAWLREQEKPVAVADAGKRVAGGDDSDDFPRATTVEEAEDLVEQFTLELDAAEALEVAALHTVLRATKSLARLGERPDKHYLAGVDLALKNKDYTPAMQTRREGEQARWLAAGRKVVEAKIAAGEAKLRVSAAARQLQFAQSQAASLRELKRKIAESEHALECALTRVRLHADADMVWGEGWRERSGVAP